MKPIVISPGQFVAARSARAASSRLVGGDQAGVLALRLKGYDEVWGGAELGGSVPLLDSFLRVEWAAGFTQKQNSIVSGCMRRKHLKAGACWVLDVVSLECFAIEVA